MMSYSYLNVVVFLVRNVNLGGADFELLQIHNDLGLLLFFGQIFLDLRLPSISDMSSETVYDVNYRISCNAFL